MALSNKEEPPILSFAEFLREGNHPALEKWATQRRQELLRSAPRNFGNDRILNMWLLKMARTDSQDQGPRLTLNLHSEFPSVAWDRWDFHPVPREFGVFDFQPARHSPLEVLAKYLIHKGIKWTIDVMSPVNRQAWLIPESGLLKFSYNVDAERDRVELEYVSRTLWNSCEHLVQWHQQRYRNNVRYRRPYFTQIIGVIRRHLTSVGADSHHYSFRFEEHFRDLIPEVF